MMKSQTLATKILILAMLLTACSSSAPKKDLPTDDGSGSAEVETAAPAESKSFAAPTPAKAGNASALADAIRSGNDDSIFHAGSASLMQNPNDVKALNAMGLYHYRKGRPLAARLFFRKALTIQPKSSELYSNIGLTYLSTKEEDEAIVNFRKAIEINPSDASASVNLGSIYLAHREFAKAYNVLSLSPSRNKDIKFLNNFAIVSAWKGNTEQAEGLYREALKSSPNNRELLFNYAILQIDFQGKYKDGLETLDHLKLIGLAESMKNTEKELEIKAKAGLK